MTALPPATTPDVVVVGAGPAGMMAASAAAEEGVRVVLCEYLPRAGTKLLATGGGRCNITNTLPVEEFIERFGRFGKYARPALTLLGPAELRAFLERIGVATHAPDGFRVFPCTHQASTVVRGLEAHLRDRKVPVRDNTRVRRLIIDGGSLAGIETDAGSLRTKHVIIATGGRSYRALGATDDGYQLAQQAGHTITDTWPAMVPLVTAQTWPSRCRADTIPKVEVSVALPKCRRLRNTGDLIFTQTGLAGPVILDFSRHIPPLLSEHSTVPLRLGLTDSPVPETWNERLRTTQQEKPQLPLADFLEQAMPLPLAEVMCDLTQLTPGIPLGQVARSSRLTLAAILAQTPIDVTGTEGFGKAMVTRGGVSLKEVAPETLQSRHLPGLFFAGEILDLDGPCGGFNLQWAFASGYLAGKKAGRQSVGK